MPEGAANPGGHTPRRIPTPPAPARLYDGHIAAECSLRYNGAPECPACLTLRLNGDPRPG